MVELQHQIVEQQRQLAELTARNAALQAEIERLTRDAKRQAAPFSKGTRVTTPKRPGRKPGVGPFRYRALPLPEQITEPLVEVPVTLDACLACGGISHRGAAGVGLYDRHATHPSAGRNPVSRGGLSVHSVRHAGTRAASGRGAGSIRGHRASPGGPGDGRGACLALWGGTPRAQGPSRVGSVDGDQLTQGAITQDAMRRAAQWAMSMRPCGLPYLRPRSCTPMIRAGASGESLPI